MGRLIKDPVLIINKSDKSQTSFKIAVPRDFKSTQNYQDTDFISCIAFGNRADFICNNFKKGELIIISGRLQIREYIEGIKKNWFTEIFIETAYFAGSKPKDKEYASSIEASKHEEEMESILKEMPF